MINNRQNGRRRGRGGNNNNPRSGNPGRPDSGNRIDSRARGNANQLYEKYKNLARDAQMQGDRVNTEYYLQFADHYFRVLNETRMRFEEQNPNAPQQRRIQPVDSFDDFDEGDDYGDEGEPIRAGEQQAAQEPRDSDQNQRGPRGQRDSQRDGRDGGQRDTRDTRDNVQRSSQGQPQPRYDGRRDERYDAGRGDGGRSDTGRYDGARRNGHAGDDAERGGDPGDRGDDGRTVERMLPPPVAPVANDLGDDAPGGAQPLAAEPRRRGRPRRVVADESGTGAEAPAALDADRLPPSLSIITGADDAGDDDGAPRPRRRRVRAAGETPSLG